MHRTIIIAVASAGLLALGACGSLGQRSTLAQLQERCDGRGGTLIAGSSAAEGGVRCVGASTRVGNNSATVGRSPETAQMSRRQISR